jgi:hypothetical protein
MKIRIETDPANTDKCNLLKIKKEVLLKVAGLVHILTVARKNAAAQKLGAAATCLTTSS